MSAGQIREYREFKVSHPLFATVFLNIYEKKPTHHLIGAHKIPRLFALTETIVVSDLNANSHALTEKNQ